MKRSFLMFSYNFLIVRNVYSNFNIEKNIIDYLFPTKKIIVLEKIDSDYGPMWVYNSEYKGNINTCLSFDIKASVRQSCINKVNPDNLEFEYYKMIFGSLYINSSSPNKVLILGLGGGILAKSFAKLLPNSQIDVVEINDKVLLVANKYFDFEQTNNIKVYVNDAADFMTNSTNDGYDLVICDAFSNDYIPPHLLTLEFMKNIKNKMSADGVLAFNSFTDSKYNNLENKLVENSFDHYYILSGYSGNRIIIASKKTLPSLSVIKENAEKWKSLFNNYGIKSEWLLKTFNTYH